MKIQNMRSILVGIKRTLKYNLIILSEKLMLHIILQGMRYGLLYVESNSLWGHKLVKEISKKVGVETGEKRSTFFLFQSKVTDLRE